MESFKKFFGFEDENNLNKLTILYLIIAYIFSIAVRYIYIQKVGSIPTFLWQHHLMINNNDGYYWAEGARDILAGFHQANDLSPIDTPATLFTAYLAKILPFIPFDVLIEYLPGFIGSLIVIPVILIGRILGSTWLGFLAALLSGIAWSYYHRTMFGYYDTDMLVIVLPVSAIAMIMYGFEKKQKFYFFFATLIEIFMSQWHGGLFNIANGLFIMSFIYIIILKRGAINNYLFLLYLIIPVLPVSCIAKYTIALIYLLMHQFILENKVKHLQQKPKIVWSFLTFVVIIYLSIVGLPWLNDILHSSYFTRAVTNTVKGDKLHYFSVVNTVREAGHISYDTIAHRISGSWIGFILGVLGYFFLMIRYPILMISLPMVALGFFTIKGGLRFTIFAVPFMALGDAYIAYLIGKVTHKAFLKDTISKGYTYFISFVIMAAIIYPNYKHVYRYLVPTVFNKYEVATLDKLKHIAGRNDYVMTWWDYGYPIRYYADVKTFIDGGKHSGDVNYPVSFALTRNLKSSRNMAILDAYFNEYNYKHNKSSDYLKSMLDKYHTKDPNDFLALLSTDIKLPSIKEDIYYFLPLRMFNILPTIALFSNIDLKTGKEQRHFFFQANSFKKAGNNILLGNGVKILLNKKVILVGNQIVPIHYFAITEILKNGKTIKKIDKFSNRGLNIIYMKSYRKWLILDDFFFDSTFVQLFVFENTGGLFKPVIINPYVKIYKVSK